MHHEVAVKLRAAFIACGQVVTGCATRRVADVVAAYGVLLQLARAYSRRAPETEVLTKSFRSRSNRIDSGDWSA